MRMKYAFIKPLLLFLKLQLMITLRTTVLHDPFLNLMRLRIFQRYLFLSSVHERLKVKSFSNENTKKGN